MRIAFVCVENSNRSQMAEAFARMAAIEAYSAGSRPSGEIHPTAIEAMKELGYNLSVHRSKGLDELPKKRYDIAITMGCGDDCPNIVADRREDWDVPDPKEMHLSEFREVRDLIRRKVHELLPDELNESQFAGFPPLVRAAAIAYCKHHPDESHSLSDLYEAIDLELGHLSRLMQRHGEGEPLACYRDYEEHG
jgi:arsenate reductase (thioredoxin)